ncbi:MAG TPA: pseudouridine synthase, partial [Herpetosiphon sp.]
MERLHKFLARAGVDSRRACEELMLAGRVSVNGRVQRELGTQIDPDKDDIRVDGEQITPPTELHYVLLHKPSSVMTTLHDPEGRQTVADLVKSHNRLFPVGRLDYDSEGLLLLTDDGDLTFRLTHPSFEVEKEYQALLNQTPSVEQLREWRNGVELDDGKTAPAWIELLNETADGTWVRVVIHEGRNRQIRRVAEALGLEVRRLIRLREGPLTLGELQAGQWRALTPTEIDRLRMHGKQSKAWTPVRPQENAEGGKPRRQVRRIDRSGQLVERRADVEPRLQRAPHFTSQENTMSFEDFSIEEERSTDRPRRRPEPRREGGFSDRGPRRDGGSPSDDRGPRREGGFSERGPRREAGDFGDRGPRREAGFGERGPRRDGGGFGERGPRRDGDGPRRDFGDRGPRREG